jgi:uncharacterized protein (UPF0261 family)
MATIALLGTLDTKGEEFAYLQAQILQRGHQTLVIDVGTHGPPRLHPDWNRHQVAQVAGVNLDPILARQDRGEAVTTMSQAAPVLIQKLAAEGKINAILSLGGGGGTAIATAAMRVLPIGFPKLMVSTLASGNTAPYVGVKDIVMFPSIVDIAGLNRISRELLARAAGAICGMVETQPARGEDKKIIVASQFGNTTPCVEAARKRLEEQGYEVLVFAAVGSGGRIMESLVESGLVSGVLDITTTEWADELVGGVLGAGPHRLEAAAKTGTPAIVVPGCLDMVNFGPPETVPARFKDRLFYQHNPQVTLMRTTPGECTRLGEIMADKLNRSRGPVTVLIPMGGISMISMAGQPFHHPAADQALFDSLKGHLRQDIPVLELDCAINDPPFAQACVETLCQQLARANP